MYYKIKYNKIRSKLDKLKRKEKNEITKWGSRCVYDVAVVVVWVVVESVGICDGQSLFQVSLVKVVVKLAIEIGVKERLRALPQLATVRHIRRKEALNHTRISGIHLHVVLPPDTIQGVVALALSTALRIHCSG